MDLNLLEEIDDLKKVFFEKCECYIHENHRWVIPIIFEAQQKEILPKPCTLVMFDAHWDFADPNCIEEIRRIRKKGIKLHELIVLCRDSLAKNDGDWIKAAMELGIIDNAVVFGEPGTWQKYRDHRGQSHRTEMLSLPLSELTCHDGKLCDTAQGDLFSKLWQILEWEYDQQNGGFSFKNGGKRILLDFDLDCFICRYLDCKFPWPDELYASEFFVQSTNRKTNHWTGKKFLDRLVDKAGLLTIACESECCSGAKNSQRILSKVNRFLFDDKLAIEKESLAIEDVLVKWSRWFPWKKLESHSRPKTGIGIPNRVKGVVEVRCLKNDELLICRGTNNIKRLVKDYIIKDRYEKRENDKKRENSVTKVINGKYNTADLLVRWCETERPFTVEKQLRHEYKKIKGEAPRFLK